MGRLGFSNTETDFLSYGEYYDLYRAYQQCFDIENTMSALLMASKGDQRFTFGGAKSQNDTEGEAVYVDFDKYL